MEKRKTSPTKSSPLPKDYLQMVAEVFSSHFDEPLKLYQSVRPNSHFEIRGEVYSNEIVVAVSLVSDGCLSATTIHASCDFDPKASSPTVEDLLSASVDAIGSIFGTLLTPTDPARLALLAEDSLSSLENVPFDWTEVESDQKQIFLKLDKSNPTIEALADQWLKANDPELRQEEDEEEEETKKLFVTGASAKSRAGSGSGMVH